MNQPLWIPSREYAEKSALFAFKEFVEDKLAVKFAHYDELHEWSIVELEQFWEMIIQFFDISYSGTYDSVLQGFSSDCNDFISSNWFDGIFLNYAEHIFKQRNPKDIALKFSNEFNVYQQVTWQELSDQVGKIQLYLREHGIEKGDRIVGILNNTVDTIALFLAVNSLGAIWSCCSPDFGYKSITDRFSQIKPKMLFVQQHYWYNGKSRDITEIGNCVGKQLGLLEEVIFLGSAEWKEILQKQPPANLMFERVAFSHPIWILYSSGTTGIPKAITHGTGGILLEHYKALALHQNVSAGDNFLWYSSAGWMMWNYALSSLLCGATLCLYDGAINHANHSTFWNFVRQAEVHHLGAGAAYFTQLPLEEIAIDNYMPKVIGSTGSPLPAEIFLTLQQKFPEAQIISLSGGTDVCSAFLSGNALLPVYAGQLQCRTLGSAVVAYDETGQLLYDTVGELVILKPMPSMPIYFWGDTGDERYRSSYFEKFRCAWCHGDWIKIISKQGIIIYGRSDATLNRAGIRIGTAEIYNALNSLDDIVDSLVITAEQEKSATKMILFVQTSKDCLNESLKEQIRSALRTQYSARHVPDAIYEVSDIPYTLSGKKLELPIKKIFSGIPLENAVSKDIMRNPESLHDFVKWYVLSQE